MTTDVGGNILMSKSRNEGFVRLRDFFVARKIRNFQLMLARSISLKNRRNQSYSRDLLAVCICS